mgnify:CR=1 FL=1
MNLIIGLCMAVLIVIMVLLIVLVQEVQETRKDVLRGLREINDTILRRVHPKLFAKEHVDLNFGQCKELL